MIKHTRMLLAALAVSAAAVYGDDATPLRLTLTEAVQTALRQNPQVQVASLSLTQSRQDQAIAASDLMPHAGAQVSDAALRGNFETYVGKPLPIFPRQIGPFQLFQAGGGFTAPVFDMTLWHKWRASGLATRGAAAQEQAVREQLTFLVVSQYLGALRAEAALQAADSRVELAEALFKLASDLQEHGSGTGIDTLRANVQLQSEKQRQIVLKTQRETMLLGLARLLNTDRRIELDSDLSFVPMAAESDANVKGALESRPEMQALAAKSLSVARLRDAASAARYPSIRATGEWAYQGLSASDGIPTYDYRVAINIPLFTGGRIRAERAKAELELKKVDEEKAELRNRIGLEVKVASAELESARSQVEVANLTVGLATEEVAQARDRFEAGVANNLEVVSAQNELAAASDNQVNALYRYNQSRADLARATGQLQALYAK
jgi:outer membrane protein